EKLKRFNLGVDYRSRDRYRQKIDSGRDTERRNATRAVVSGFISDLEVRFNPNRLELI
ncbi:hypothetical protein MCOR04_008827, partial [Pyricularia oryzae]